MTATATTHAKSALAGFENVLIFKPARPHISTQMSGPRPYQNPCRTTDDDIETRAT